MKRLLFIAQILGVLLLFSCGQNKTAQKGNDTLQSQETISVPDALFKIISEKEHVDPRFGFNKCNIVIELPNKISKDQLTSIANKLRKTRDSFDKLWIFYNLVGMQSADGPWAITHFTPNLEVEILGSTDEEDEKMKDVTVDGNMIGKWQDTRPYSDVTMIIFEKNNQIYMKRAFPDGSSGDSEFIKKKQNGKIRFELKENTHKEYYLIEENGNLGMYGENGKFGEAVKID